MNVFRSWVPDKIWRASRVAKYLAREKPGELMKLLGRVVPSQLCEVLANYEGTGTAAVEEFQLRLYNTTSPLSLRRGTSDFNMFRRALINEQYAVGCRGPVEYVMDAGANAGFASVFFPNRYPNARVISIEPDPENFEVARRNLQPYSDRCHLLLAGVWSREGTLSIRRTTAGSGRISHCSTQTQPAAEDDDLVVPARSTQSLMDEFQFPRIDYLKVDIEGAELAVFRDGDISFLKKTNCCAVECHGEECLAAFTAAAESEGFRLQHSGELTVATRPSLLSALSGRGEER